MAEDKGNKPSERRLRKARQEGTVIKSPLVSACATFLVIISIAYFGLRLAWVRNRMLLEYFWTNGYVNPGESFEVALKIAVISIGSCLIFGVAACIIACLAQVGFKIEPAVLSPRLARLDFAAGLSRILTSLKSVGSIGTKLFIFGLVFCWLTYSFALEIPGRAFIGTALSLEFLDAAIFRCLSWSAVLLGLAATWEYFWKRRDFYRQLSMSFAEVKEESKEDNGDPHIRSARRAMHRALSMEEVVDRVKRSKVIVVQAAMPSRGGEEKFNNVAQS